MARASASTRKTTALTPQQIKRREVYERAKAKKRGIIKPTAPVIVADSKVLDGHYLQLAIQPIEIIEANNLSFHEGSALKYLLRWKEKGGISDLLKARFYLNRILELNGYDSSDNNITAPPVRRTS